MGFNELPQSSAWEIDLVPMPSIVVQDVKLAGMLLVVDREGGLVRAGEPVPVGVEIEDAVLRAVAAPVPPNQPARPAEIFCRPALEPALSPLAAALGATLVVVAELPLIDDVAQSMLGHFQSTPRMLPRDPDSWRPPVAALAMARPWEHLDQAAHFRFSGGPAALDGAVGVLLGQAIEQRGVMLFPTVETYTFFRENAWGRATTPPQGWRFWCVHLDPVDDFQAPLLQETQRMGLVHGGLALRLFVLTEQGPQPMSEREETACLAAFQGIAAAWTAYGKALEPGGPIRDVPVAGGTLRVEAVAEDEIDEVEPLILDIEHSLIFTSSNLDGQPRPTLALKMAKRNAEALAELTASVDAITLVARTAGTLDVVAWAGTERVGVLTRMAASEEPWLDWRTMGGGVITLVGGGAKRTKLRRKDVVNVKLVAFREPDEDRPLQGEAAPAASGEGADLYQSDAVNESSWDGPPETWPKASTVLLKFAEPLGIHRMPSDVVERGATIAAMLWSAVVLADQGGNPGVLEQVRAQAADQAETAEAFERMIARKRNLFPKDSRIMVVEGCAMNGEQLDVRVKWTLATADKADPPS
jgi:hypothetical protein